MRIKAAFFTWSNKNPLVHFFVPFCIILLISRHYFPKMFVLFWCCAVVNLARESLYMVNPLITPLTAQNCNPSWQAGLLRVNLRSGCIFVSAVAVRENVWEPPKLGLISGYLRVFSFFISRLSNIALTVSVDERAAKKRRKERRGELHFWFSRNYVIPAFY